MLNAILKVNDYADFFGGLPEDELIPYIRSASEVRNTAIEITRATGMVARGSLRSAMYADRFNMNPNDIELLKAQAGPYVGIDITPEVAWGNYVRFLFQPNTFYQFSKLSETSFLYVAENKSLPGRDVPGSGDAIGRPLFFFSGKNQSKNIWNMHLELHLGASTVA